MALVAILNGNDDLLFLLPWMATRAIPTLFSNQINIIALIPFW